jgi:hypothetical protein
MQRRDLRQAQIVLSQRGSDDPQPRHDPIDCDLGAIGTAQQEIEIVSWTNGKSIAAPFDERRAPEPQSVDGAGDAEVAIPALAQSPEMLIGSDHEPSLINFHRTLSVLVCQAVCAPRRFFGQFGRMPIDDAALPRHT